MAMEIAIIGAGFAGIATARVLLRLKHKVTIFESMPDIGGVWSTKRAYPDLCTQSPASTYHLSEMPWPPGTHRFPTSQQVQSYLEAYASEFGIIQHVKLSTRVVSTVQLADKRWRVAFQQTDTEGTPLERAPVSEEIFNIVVVCNGSFSRPRIPDLPGLSAFQAAGGCIIHSSQFRDARAAASKDVLVIGYGKSACDVASAAATCAKNTTVVARRVHWKFPTMLLGVISTHKLLMSRLGESLFPFKVPGSVSAALNGPFRVVRYGMIQSLRFIAEKQCNMKALGLVPKMSIDEAADAAISGVSEGFFEMVSTGKITVMREAEVASVGTTPGGRPCAMVDNGKTLPVDMIVAGTGWTQSVPFLSDQVLSQFRDLKGNFMLYRTIKPANVENLYFNGYNGSLFSVTTQESAALWIASAIEGTLDLPPPEAQQQDAEEMVAFLESRGLKHAHATNWIPFSMSIIDRILADMRVQVSRLAYWRQWLLPARSSSYKAVADEVVSRIEAVRARVARA